MKYVFSPCQTATSTTLAGHEKLDTCRPQNVVGQVGRKKTCDSLSYWPSGVLELVAVCSLRTV